MASTPLDGEHPANPGPAERDAARAHKRSVRAARRVARAEIAAARDTDADGEALAHAVLDLVSAHVLGRGSAVTLYESFAGEPPTEATIDALVARGIRVLVPITLPDLDLDWTEVGDPTRRPRGRHAIADADLVLAPGLSVDRDGTRLGQGGGCYDRALPRRRDGVRVVVVLHPGELLEDPLPRDPHDQVVDGVVTVAGTRWLSPSPG